MTRRTLEDAKPVDHRGKMCSVSPRHRMFDGSSLESLMAFLTEVVVGPGWACLAFEALANDRLHSAVVTAVPDMNQFRCALEFYHWSLRNAVLTFIEVDHLSCSRPNIKAFYLPCAAWQINVCWTKPPT